MSMHRTAATIGGGLLLSSVAGGIASVLFATDKCSVVGEVGYVCTKDLNDMAGFATTAIGIVLTAGVAATVPKSRS
jgi:hypothetical protein